MLLNSVIKSQFTCCPLMWMFMSCYLNIHEWALRLIYNDLEKSSNRILTKNNLKIIHQKTSNFLQLKFKDSKIACLHRSWIIFLSQDKIFMISESFKNYPPQLKSKQSKFGTVSISYRGPLLQNLISDNTKSELTSKLF